MITLPIASSVCCAAVVAEHDEAFGKLPDLRRLRPRALPGGRIRRENHERSRDRDRTLCERWQRLVGEIVGLIAGDQIGGARRADRGNERGLRGLLLCQVAVGKPDRRQ